MQIRWWQSYHDRDVYRMGKWNEFYWDIKYSSYWPNILRTTLVEAREASAPWCSWGLLPPARLGLWALPPACGRCHWLTSACGRFHMKAHVHCCAVVRREEMPLTKTLPCFTASTPPTGACWQSRWKRNRTVLYRGGASQWERSLGLALQMMNWTAELDLNGLLLIWFRFSLSVLVGTKCRCWEISACLHGYVGQEVGLRQACSTLRKCVLRMCVTVSTERKLRYGVSGQNN